MSGILRIFVGCITVLSILGLASCENKKEEIFAIKAPGRQASQTGKGITLLYSDSGRLKVKVQAPEMQKFDSLSTVFPKGVYTEFYNTNGTVGTTLRADHAERFEAGQRIELRNNVVVINEKGDKLLTEKLIWDEVRQRIYTDAPIKIYKGQEIWMGTGLESNQDFTDYEIKNISGIMPLNLE